VAIFETHCVLLQRHIVLQILLLFPFLCISLAAYTYVSCTKIVFIYFSLYKSTKQSTRHWASTSTRCHFAFGLCCHSNKTPASILKPPNIAQIGSTPYHFPNLHLGPCSSVGMGWQTKRQTDRRTWPIHISRRLRLTGNVVNTFEIGNKFSVAQNCVTIVYCCL